MTTDELHAILRADVLAGAQALLGSTLRLGELSARIVETEAYRASDDPASHAFRGRTPRNWPMYLDAGLAYVYFNYGVHWMLNVTAHVEEDAAAVLIRAAEPLTGLAEMQRRRKIEAPRSLLSGPGKLAQAFGLDGTMNGLNLLYPTGDEALRLEPPERPVAWTATLRIGLAPGKGDLHPWRYVETERSAWASRRVPAS